jgi:hypothetical protein
MYQTDYYEGMLAETVTLQGTHGDTINAYFARLYGLTRDELRYILGLLAPRGRLDTRQLSL